MHEVRATVKFDLTTANLPADALIQSAKLSIYRTHEPKTNLSYGYDQDGLIFCETSNLDWSTSSEPFTTLFPQVQGASNVGSGDTLHYKEQTVGWLSFDVTSDILAMIENPSTNKGFIFRGEIEGANQDGAGHISDYSNFNNPGQSGILGSYASAENSDIAKRPKLEITYTTGGTGEDTEAPIVTITSPTASSSYKPEEIIPLHWSATDNIGVSSLKVEYSTDGGSWIEITGISGDSHNWPAPTVESNSYRIRITATDEAGNSTTETSDLFFIEEESVVIDTTNPTPNLIEWCGFGPIFDTLGSTVDTGATLISDGVVEATFTIVASNETAEEWAYGSLDCWLPEGDKNTLAKVEYIKVTYKTDGAFTFVLPQTGLSESGESYEIMLASTGSNFETVLIALSDLKQPDWVTEATPLDLSEVSSLSFAMASDNSSGTIAIKEVILYNYQGDTEVPLSYKETNKKEGFTTFVTNNGLLISSLYSGATNIELYTSQGRVLFSEKVVLSLGKNRVPLPSSLASGVYFLRAISGSTVTTKAIMVE